MSRLIKMIVAVVLSVVITAVGAAAAFAIQTGVITGENEVADIVISVIVPTNFDFTLDPLEMSENSISQIAYSNYFFINKTGAPVKVALDVEVRLNNGASLVDSPSFLFKDDISVTDKHIYFAMLGASSLDVGDMSYNSVDEHNAKGIYDASSDTLVPFVSYNPIASVEFILAPATESLPGSGIDTLASDNKGIFAFQFYGEMNTYASWSNQDIVVSGSYTITPMRNTTYESFFSNDAFTIGGWGTQLKQGYK